VEISSSRGTRLAELVPERIGRMLQSPFNFRCRAVMAHDLSVDRDREQQVRCGDAHLELRPFASPER
jgi:hypothetical protein